MNDLYGILVRYVLAFVVLVGGAGYLLGNCHGHHAERLAQNSRRIAVATPRRVAAEKIALKALERSAAAKIHRDAVKSRVIITSDSTADVDGLPTALPVPVVSLLRADDRKVKMDSLTIDALQVELVATREERDAWKERAELLRPPKFGFKAGLATGAGVVLAIIALLGR